MREKDFLADKENHLWEEQVLSALCLSHLPLLFFVVMGVHFIWALRERDVQ